jgi:hypothetical protein
MERLVRNRWIWLACLDVHSGALWELRSDRWVLHTPEHRLPIVAGESATWYYGKRGFLSPVTIAPEPSMMPVERAPDRGVPA